MDNASNTSAGSIKDNGDESCSGDDLASDAEGVWSADIEQSFQEALAIYPPCGRRKIILSEEGKMYGRNELIARYIKLRTGKSRSRKQVSSHIQVMARRKSKEIQSQLKDQASKDRAMQALSAMSSAQIVSATAIHNNNNKSLHMGIPSLLYPHVSQLGPSYPPYSSSPAQLWIGNNANHDLVKGPYGSPLYGLDKPPALPMSGGDIHPTVWQQCKITGPCLRMLEFSAFVEQQQNDTELYKRHLFVHIGRDLSCMDPMLEAVDIRQIWDKFPGRRGGLKELYEKGPQTAFFLVKFWADLSINVQNDVRSFYGVNTMFDSDCNMTIQCSTKVCSFGKQVVEKVETEYGHTENGRYVFHIHRSPMCEYMINFIHKLKHLPEKYMMNSVLENFTVLQVVVHRDTQETLLCIAYVFEVSTNEHGAQHHVYRLVKD